MVARLIAGMALLTLLASTSQSFADPAEDAELLRSAGIAADGPALVRWLRSFTPADDAASAKELVKRLGAEEFADREATVKQLIALGARAVPHLRQAVRDRDPEVATRAAHCLKVIDAGPGPEVHAAAMRLLVARQPPGAAGALLEYIPCAPHESLIEAALTALETVAEVNGKMDPALAAALGDASAVKRGAAAEILAKLGDEAPLGPVKKLLGDKDFGVRLRVGLALARRQQKEAIPVLIALLGQIPVVEQGRLESILFRLAGDESPPEPTPAKWAAWWNANEAKIDLAKLADRPALLGHTVLVSEVPGAVREVDRTGKTRWQVQGLASPRSFQWLTPERFLIAEHGGNSVSERTLAGEILWKHSVQAPLAAQKLPGGNTFIVTRSKVMEVNGTGRVVNEHSVGGQLLAAAKRLPGGQILCLTSTGSCVRLDAAGQEVHRFPIGAGLMPDFAFDAAPDGRIYIPLRNRDRIIAFTAAGKVLKEYPVPGPDAVAVLANGNLLITSARERRVVELNDRGDLVWEQRTEISPIRAIGR